MEKVGICTGVSLGVAFAVEQSRSVLLGRFSEVTKPLSEQDLLRLTLS